MKDKNIYEKMIKEMKNKKIKNDGTLLNKVKDENLNNAIPKTTNKFKLSGNDSGKLIKSRKLNKNGGEDAGKRIKKVKMKMMKNKMNFARARELMEKLRNSKQNESRFRDARQILEVLGNGDVLKNIDKEISIEEIEKVSDFVQQNHISVDEIENLIFNEKQRVQPSNRWKNRFVMIKYADDKWMCNICKKYFPVRAALSQHGRNIHKKGILLKKKDGGDVCDVCNKQFRFRKALLQHKSSISSPCHRELKCNYCAKKFLLLPTLKQHESAHEVIPCMECATTFTDKKVWRIHKEYHRTLKTRKRIFNGTSICIFGSLSNSDRLRSVIKRNGGTSSNKYKVGESTHFITTRLSHIRMESRFKIFLKTIKVVKPMWIVDCLKAGKMVDAEPYDLMAGTGILPSTKFCSRKKKLKLKPKIVLKRIKMSDYDDELPELERMEVDDVCVNGVENGDQPYSNDTQVRNDDKIPILSNHRNTEPLTDTGEMNGSMPVLEKMVNDDIGKHSTTQESVCTSDNTTSVTFSVQPKVSTMLPRNWDFRRNDLVQFRKEVFLFPLRKKLNENRNKMSESDLKQEVFHSMIEDLLKSNSNQVTNS